MIEGLYQIDWSQLTHAYGEAIDLPGLLLALASPEQTDRDIAFEMLRENIWSRGAVYEATAYTVPFLVQLLGHPLVEDKPRLLAFLAQLAAGNSPLELLGEAGLLNLDEADPEVRLRLAMERNWARVTRRAVRRGIPTYLYNLEAIQPEVRCAAAYLLACFHQETRKITPHFIRRLGFEREPLPHASLVLALGVMDAGSPAHLQILESLRTGNFHPLVRLAACISLTRLQRADTPQAVLVQLVDYLSDFDADLPARYARLPWADSHLFGDLSLILCHFGQARAPLLIPDLLAVLNRVDSPSAINIAYSLLYLAFGADGYQGGGLDELQRAALQTIAESEPVWDALAEAAEVLRMFTLPDAPEGLRAMLGETSGM
jgi:hypothetical protein